MSEADTGLDKLGLVGEDAAVVEPETLALEDDGVIPNNALAVLVYRARGAVAEDAPQVLETLFTVNEWPAQWHGGVFAFHHYHSTAHEALGVWGGWARLQLGGEQGPIVEVGAGDVLVLPAGTGHCRIETGGGFGVVGAYPSNQPDWDMCRADPGIREAALARIAAVPLPTADPVGGRDGPLMRLWTGH